MTMLLIATRNTHKAGEIRAILGNKFRYLTLNDFPDAPTVVEDADAFAGNATKKATELAHWFANIRSSMFDVGCLLAIHRSSMFFVLADDSGLEVDALGGLPGVHSARFAALDQGADSLSTGNSTDAGNNAKLLRLLKDVPLEKRTARFRCVLALAEANPKSETQNPKLFDGVCEGRIDFAPRGSNGFGYDPLFIPDGFEQSFAELGEDVKNRLSHRAKALAKLKDYFGCRD
jgi:XTP/dITP diphosphohydrolase